MFLLFNLSNQPNNDDTNKQANQPTRKPTYKLTSKPTRKTTRQINKAIIKPTRQITNSAPGITVGHRSAIPSCSSSPLQNYITMVSSGDNPVNVASKRLPKVSHNQLWDDVANNINKLRSLSEDEDAAIQSSNQNIEVFRNFNKRKSPPEDEYAAIKSSNQKNADALTVGVMPACNGKGKPNAATPTVNPVLACTGKGGTALKPNSVSPTVRAVRSIKPKNPVLSLRKSNFVSSLQRNLLITKQSFEPMKFVDRSSYVRFSSFHFSNSEMLRVPHFRRHRLLIEHTCKASTIKSKPSVVILLP